MTSVAVDAVSAIRERIAEASREGTALRITGQGTWLDAGRPVSGSDILSTRELSGITEYVPGDLTLTARAGTTLEEIRAATAAHGQWLALDPYGSNDGSIGATIATGSAGPLQTSFGRARDLVLGLQFVTGAGLIARGGGRVVKNVAGFDLVRLLTGSWGTLGVITEVAMRLHARPEVDESLAIGLAPGDGPERVRQMLRRLPFVPYSCEILNETLAKSLTGMEGIIALVRLGGNREAVRAQRTAFADLGDVRDVDPRVWNELRATEPRQAIVFRLSRLPSEIERTWAEAATLVSQVTGLLLHANPARGIVRCIVPFSETNEQTVAGLLRSMTDAVRLGERLPQNLWPLCSANSGGEIAARIQRTFDPSGVLNPGILGTIA